MKILLVDEASRPQEGISFNFHETRRNFQLRGILPAGVAPWGLALEATTGLPHATLTTDSHGSINLRDVPLGTWSVELLKDAKIIGTQNLVVTEDSKIIKIVLDQ